MNAAASWVISADIIDQTAKPSSFAILIPAKDEALLVGQVVASVRRHFSHAHLIVIDDGSGDETAAEAAEAGATVLRLPVSLGAWGAIQTGMRYALRLGCETAVTMDADGQHLAEEIPKLMEALEREQAEVVIGAFPERGSPARQIAWRFFRALTGFEFADLTSGFRVYRRRALSLLASPRASLLEYQDVGVLLLLRAQGLKIAETEVSMQPRLEGKSRVFSSWWRVGVYLFQTLILCLANPRFKR
ncbi:glycosyltransferase family 2 protein [Methylohalobius crimeensis]|uniref:glycosyltransferase family 2 protein n=1 Tax=Methylohalobius crimeensis TaxID=244365 RepID=UPI00041A50D4|nr:glycosyltransferase family 2 protein [Methylohalobius crimeensis]